MGFASRKENLAAGELGRGGEDRLAAATIADFTMRAALLRSEAELWTMENPDAWAEIVRFAKREAASERRFSMRYAAEAVRRKDYCSLSGERSQLNNNMLPALARLLVGSFPEVAPFLELRRSSCDSAFKDVS